MKKYYYKAKKGPNAFIKGVIDAASESEAVNKIVESGYAPIQVSAHEANISNAVNFSQINFSLRRSVSKKAVCFFTRQMSDMFNAGVSLIRALEVMIKQTKDAAMLRITEDLYQNVKMGDSFSGALSKHTDVFSPLYINLIKSGELSGQLGPVMQRLYAFLDADIRLRSRVMMSMLYPSFILFVGVMSIFIMLTFVLPNLAVVFEDSDMPLPLSTRIVLGASYFLQGYWWAIVIIMSVVCAYGYRFNRSAEGRAWIDQKILAVPLLNEFIKQVEIGRASRTIATLLDGGVPLVDALNSAVDVLGNVVIKEQMLQISQEVKNGVDVSSAFESTILDQAYAAVMIRTGEESGQLAQSFYKLAGMCEQQVAEVTEIVVNVMGWVVLMFVVAVIGGIVISMLLPIFQMNLIIQ